MDNLILWILLGLPLIPITEYLVKRNRKRLRQKRRNKNKNHRNTDEVINNSVR